MNKFITIYTTFPSLDEAKKICNYLLTEKIIAGVNYIPIESGYHWKGEIVNSNEYVGLLKTRGENWEKIKEYILENHSYETPCMIKTEVEANQSYVEWIYSETK